MRIEFTHVRDRAYARRLLAVSMLRARIVTGLLGVVLVTSAVLSFRSEDLWALFGSSMVLGLGVCWMIKPFIMLHQVVARLPESWFGPRTYLLTDDELAWRSAFVRTALSWDLVARVRKHPFGFVLWQAGGLASWDIPRTSMTVEQDRELTEFLARRGSSGAVAAGPNVPGPNATGPTSGPDVPGSAGGPVAGAGVSALPTPPGGDPAVRRPVP